MKVLHYVTSFSPLSEIFIYDYVTELERQGIENYVLTNNRQNIENRSFDKVSVVQGPGSWHPERVLRRARKFIRDEHSLYARWPILRRRLAKEIKKIKPNVIHAHFGPKGVEIAPVAEKLGVPLVTTFYGYDISYFKEDEFWVSEYQVLWKNVSAIIVLSEEMRESVRSIHAPDKKVHTVHIGRDISQFSFKKPLSAISNFISVGRLTPKKGHFDSIEAVLSLKKKGYQIKLDIVGNGKLKDDLEYYIESKHGESVVSLLGALPNKRVIEKMYEADAFILSSKKGPNGDKEGTPTVLISAQAIGLPCISTVHAGIPEMIPDGNQQFLAEEGNVEQLSEKMEKLMNLTPEELLEVAVRGREKIEQEFNLKYEVQKLINIYKQIV